MSGLRRNPRSVFSDLFCSSLALAVVTACHPATTASTSPPVRPPAARLSPATRTPPVAVAPPHLEVPDDTRARELVTAMLARVTRARQLTATSRVTARTLARLDLLAQVRSHVTRDVPREVVRAQGDVLLALGFLPPGFDFEQGMFDLLEAQLAGYYEPEDKTMYLAADLAGPEADATLAHELVHALQDQHYDLGPRLRYRQDEGDRSSAVQSLAEGDAMSAMIDVLAEGRATALDLSEDLIIAQMRSDTFATMRNIPPILKTSLTAPYIDGMRFVHALRRRGGWAAVDRTWTDPPSTTEQLLHPDKYDQRERATPLPPLPTTILDGNFRVAFTDILGEQTLRTSMEEWGNHRDAAAAAAGWGADRVALFLREQKGQEERFVFWHLRFDDTGPTCPEATEAFRFIAHGVSEGKKKVMNPAGDAACRERSRLGPLAVVRRRCDVLLGAGPFARSGKDGSGGLQSAGNCAATQRWLTTIASKE